MLTFLCGEWGAQRVVFNIEAENYYRRYTFITTLIKQEKHVFILVILYIWEHLCVFTKLFSGIRRFLVPEITKNAQPQLKLFVARACDSSRKIILNIARGCGGVKCSN